MGLTTPDVLKLSLHHEAQRAHGRVLHPQKRVVLQLPRRPMTPRLGCGNTPLLLKSLATYAYKKAALILRYPRVNMLFKSDHLPGSSRDKSTLVGPKIQDAKFLPWLWFCCAAPEG